MGYRERRLALVCRDGFAPASLDRLLGEERLPALTSVRRHGSEVAITSTLPVAAGPR